MILYADVYVLCVCILGQQYTIKQTKKPNQKESHFYQNSLHYHHHVALLTRISLTLSCYPSLSSVALWRSSWQHPESFGLTTAVRTFDIVFSRFLRDLLVLVDNMENLRFNLRLNSPDKKDSKVFPGMITLFLPIWPLFILTIGFGKTMSFDLVCPICTSEKEWNKKKIINRFFKSIKLQVMWRWKF